MNRERGSAAVFGSVRADGPSWKHFLGRRIGGYHVLRLVGRGSFSAVFKAVHALTEREVALKVVTRVAGRSFDSLMNEGRLLSRFDHPNVVRVIDAGISDGVFYLAMELLEGQTLAQVMRGGRSFTPRAAVHIAYRIGRGLSVAHAKGVVHRDLKPSNVFLLPGWKVKLLDFGLADAFTGPLLAGERLSGGTPEYMAPEQWKKMSENARTDLYALGAILFRMLTGRPLWTAMTLEEMRAAHLRAPVPAMPGIPAGLAVLVRRLLQKDPQLRPESAQEVLEVLDRLQHEHPELVSRDGLRTVLCRLCETPNVQDAEVCRSCGERLSLKGWSSAELLPDVPSVPRSFPPALRLRRRRR